MVCMDWRPHEKMLLTFVGGREATGQTPAHRSHLEVPRAVLGAGLLLLSCNTHLVKSVQLCIFVMQRIRKIQNSVGDTL